MPATRCRAAASAAFAHRTSPGGIWRTTSVSPASTRNMRSSFSGNYDLPGKGAILGGWRTNWVLSIYSGQAQTINCSVGDGSRHRLLRAGRRRSVRGPPRREPVLQPGRVRGSERRSPRSGRPTSARSAAQRSQVTGPPLRQLDMGFAKQIQGQRADGSSRFASRSFNVTNTPAFNLPGSLNFLDARNFASITTMRNTPRQIQLGAKFYW